MNKLNTVYIIVMLVGFVLDMFNSIIHYFSHEYTAAVWWLILAIFLYDILLRTTKENKDD